MSKSDRLLSVSDYPDLAAAVAGQFGFGRMGYRPGLPRGVYVFELKLPELDLVYMEKGNPILPLPKSAQGGHLIVKNPKGKKYVRYALDRKVVSFVFFGVEPAEVAGFKRVENVPLLEWED
jgi:hypothetical protein